ncbi:MAG: helix-turn-helix domain-containing protein [Salinivirgaceae bacterium]|nr:helix-turn-helix domain-containing protein [Salinivirgaceae bacterium]
MQGWSMLLDFVLIFGMSLLFLIVLFVLNTKPNDSKKILIFFFINAFFFLLYYYSFSHKAKYLGAIAIFFGSGTGFLLGPLLLFYIKSLVLSSQKYLSHLFVHLIPFLIYWFVISLPLSLDIAFDLFHWYRNGYPKLADFINLAENVYFINYIVLSFQLIRKILKASKDQYSTIEKEDLQWLIYLITGLTLAVIVDSAFSVYELNFPMISWNIGTVIAFLLVILYSILGFKGLFQSKILLPEYALNPDKDLKKASENSHRENEEKKILQLNSLSANEIEQLKIKLYKILEFDKPFLDDSLSLTELASQIGISNKQLSELLNQHLKVNFYNLINDYRISEVKKRLENYNSNKETLLGIAFESGFQSKASFNRVFKLKTGLSPSKYLKKP